MSVVVMKKRFEAPPSKEEISNLLVEGNLGDAGKAKDALVKLLAPMKDLLALYDFMDKLDAASGKYATLLKEYDAAEKELAGLKAQTETAKATHNAAVKKLAPLTAQIAELETKRDAVAAEIESEEQAKLRVNKVVSDEYDRLRSEMLTQVKVDEVAAKRGLKAIEAKVAAAQAELDALAEKKRQFIASLG